MHTLMDSGLDAFMGHLPGTSPVLSTIIFNPDNAER